ncbi:MAG: bacteriohemerythrin [Bacteroidales bacterium]|nr:bacteriohemerythrin [Bacteroidales bacterium]
MDYLTWRDSFSVKIEKFDLQHQQLFGILNNLLNAIKLNKGIDTLKRILNDLKVYAIAHFEEEERYLQVNNFPDYYNQKKEHEYFIKQVQKFIQELDQGKDSLTTEVSTFLNSWIKNHICIEDKKYSLYLVDNKAEVLKNV